MKNITIHKLGHGKIDKALGKILKLSYGPDSAKSLIFIPI